MDDITVDIIKEQLKRLGFTNREDLKKFVEEYECYICTGYLEAPITLRCGHNVCRECYKEFLDAFFGYEFKDDAGDTFFEMYKRATTCGACYKPHNLLSSMKLMSGLVKIRELPVVGCSSSPRLRRKYHFEAGWKKSFEDMKAKVKEEFEEHVHCNTDLLQLLQKTGMRELLKVCEQFKNKIEEQVSIFLDSIFAAMLTLFLSHGRKIRSEISLSSDCRRLQDCGQQLHRASASALMPAAPVVFDVYIKGLFADRKNMIMRFTINADSLLALKTEICRRLQTHDDSDWGMGWLTDNSGDCPIMESRDLEIIPSSKAEPYLYQGAAEFYLNKRARRS